MVPTAISKTEGLGATLNLRNVLNVFGHGDPEVLAFLVDGDSGRRKHRIGEDPHWDGDVLLCAGRDVKDSRAAYRTERERTFSALVANANELRALTVDVYGFSCEPCLSAKYAPGSALTGVAVADGNANGLVCDFGSELATTAGCGASNHDKAYKGPCSNGSTLRALL